MYVVPGMSATVFLGSFLGIQLLLFPVMSKLVNTVPKTMIYRFGLPLSILGAAGIAFFPAGGPPMIVYGLAALTALGFAGAQTMTWIMFPDVVDIGDLSLGERITGSFGGLMSFIRTVSYAIAAFIIGQILEWVGFITPSDLNPAPLQPEGTLLAIRLIILLTFVLLMGGAWFVAKRFALSPALSQKVKDLLAKRQEGGFSPQDRAEQEEIVRELG
jgi:GPH family glycoside/pentoside/hexuronide:cation symporter